MKKVVIFLSIILSSFAVNATIHIVRVWDGYYQFVDDINFSSDITIELGDTVQWLPLDVPQMVHTITSTNIPVGALPFDQIWQAPADTFFQYIPLEIGLYEYECTPHIQFGMIGSVNVIAGTTSINDFDLISNESLIYPNPATNYIYFTEPSSASTFKIYNLKGETILKGVANGPIDISSLLTGIYFTEIIGDKPRIMRFVKQ